MGYRIGLNSVWDGEYGTVLYDHKSRIELSIEPASFFDYLTILFEEVPNDFRDIIHKFIVDYAVDYFENHPISEDEKERFFELLGEITEEDYEDGE